MECKKKNGFLVFCFSFIPGAAEMYMGYIKNGMSIWTTFLVAFLLACIGDTGLAVVVVWFFAIFHAWKIYKLSGQKIEDRNVWLEYGIAGSKNEEEKKRSKSVAVWLIVIGVVSLCDYMFALFFPNEYCDVFNKIVAFVQNIIHIVTGNLL